MGGDAEFFAVDRQDEVALASESGLDDGLAQWMNTMYASGWVASLLFFLPEYGKAGDKSIPRSLRCLKGWRKLSPSFSRRPLTRPVVVRHGRGDDQAWTPLALDHGAHR